MYKAESKGRLFPAGIAAVVLVALLGLGACDGGLGPDQSEEAALNAGAVDANGLVAVRVALPQKAEGARSVTDDLIDVYSDYYEVIFKVRDPSNPTPDPLYYFAKAEAGKEYLSISVKPGQAYDVLLLVGIKKNRLLLATGFVNNADGNAYASGEEGYLVEANKANVIRPVMTYTNITPDATSEDFSFTGVDSSNNPLIFAYTRTDKIATVAVPTPTNVTSFIAHLKTDRLEDLTNAGSPTGKPLYSYNRAILYPRYTQHSFTVQYVDAETTTLPVPAKYDYVFPVGTDPLLQGDIDAKLRVELRYYAFGTKDSGSSQWNIRNGIDYGIDDGGSGGAIVVRFGAGSSFDEGVGIEFKLP
jgi:hypothetical protein